MLKNEKFLINILSYFLALFFWYWQCVHWNSILDADSALYPLMSLEILKGQHFFYTAGQVHGGTFITYFRALYFWLFKVSHFNGFWVNGLWGSLAVTLWTNLAYRLGQRSAALVFAALASLASSIFFQYSCTDYYIGAVVIGGALLNLALSIRANPNHLFLIFSYGFFLGLGLYTCRFSALYFLLSLGFLLDLNSITRSQLKKRLYQWPKYFRGLLAGAGFLFILAIIAFFSDDHFLGLNFEITLKQSMALAILTTALAEYKFLVQRSKSFALFILGVLICLMPTLYYHHTHPSHIDRVTGLVRFGDILKISPEFLFRLGSNFSRNDPTRLGLLAIISYLLLIGLANFYSKNKPLKKFQVLVTLGFGLTFLSWILIHTYMHMVIQYFYPAYFLLYLLAALSWSNLPYLPKLIGNLFLGAILVVAAGDYADNIKKPNHRLASGAINAFQQLQISEVTGDYWSTYDMMWVALGQITFDPIELSRFPQYKNQVVNAKRIGFLSRTGDTVLIAKDQLYRVIQKQSLSQGYQLEVLEKK